MKKLIHLFLFLFFARISFASSMNGMVLASWAAGDYSSPTSDQSIEEIAESHSNWMSIVWTWYQDNINSTYMGPLSNSPTQDDVKHAAATAIANGLQVVIKPHVDLSNDPTHWRGEIGTYFDQTEWNTWFSNYEIFANLSADIALQSKASILNIGTELIQTEPQESLWRHIIDCIRQRLTGSSIKLVYGTNWSPGPANVKWWDALDYIGVDAYYPLSVSPALAPSVDELTKAWTQSVPTSGTSNIFASLQSAAQQYGKLLIFTEIGYQSEQGCAVSPAGTSLGVYDPDCQANAYQSVLNVFYTQSWFAGVFWWAWSTNPNDGGKCDMGFSPHNKPAETVLQTNWPGVSSFIHPFTLRTPEDMERRYRIATGTQATPVLVYNCTSGTGWENWSWSGTVNFQATDYLAPSCKYSISANMDGWGCLSLHPSAGTLDISGFTSVNVTIQAASNALTTITIYLDDAKGNELAQTPLDKFTDSCTLSSNSFMTVTVPLSQISFGNTVISRLNLKNGQATSGQWWTGNIVFF